MRATSVVAPPTQPSQAPVELKIPPATVSTGAQEPAPVQVIVTETTTITGAPPEVPGKIDLTQALQQQPTQIQVSSGASLALQPWRDELPAVGMFWERANKAAASNDMDEQRAALFVELARISHRE
jgi:hypothetical protein